MNQSEKEVKASIEEMDEDIKRGKTNLKAFNLRGQFQNT